MNPLAPKLLCVGMFYPIATERKVEHLPRTVRRILVIAQTVGVQRDFPEGWGLSLEDAWDASVRKHRKKVLSSIK